MATKAPSPPYLAPPIVEAMVQLHFADQLKKGVNGKLLKRLKANYANEVRLKAVSANVDFQNRQTDFLEAEPQVRMSSNDETDVLIAQSDALTWSRLAPYQGWDDLLMRVRRDFELASPITGYRKLDRLGVRYINRIDVPISDGNISYYEEFIKIHLKLPDELDPTNGYAWRFERTFPDEGLTAIVQSANGVSVIPGTDPFIFDIDIVCQHGLPVKLEDICAKLEAMRKLKNMIFELSMTDRARMAFQ